DPADWLARQGGTSVGAARTAIETALALEACPDTAAAVAGGAVSLEQAREITRTEHERPGSEAELPELARNAGKGKLRDHARNLRHRAIGVEEVHRRQVAARSFRHWRNDLGNIEFRGQLPPE